MVDAIAPTVPTTGPFDTASIQIARAKAEAAAAHANEVAYLQEIAKANDAANAQALAPTAAPEDPFLTNSLFNLDASGNPTTTDPSDLTFLTEFGSTSPANAPTSDSVKAQQLHDMGVLQKDAALLEEAANENNHIPLSENASTVDLSAAAQGIVAETATATGATSLTPAQLAQAGSILQPVANTPLTPALLQQVQAGLTAAQIPSGLDFATIALVMNYIAGMQSNPLHHAENQAFPPNSEEEVLPVTAIDKVAVEDGTVR